MARIPSDFQQGLVVMDPRFSTGTISPTLSSYSQSGPSPEQPLAVVRTGYMQPESSGTITAGADYDLQIQKGGAPVGGDSGGRYVKKASTDTDYDGHLNYNKITGFEHITLGASATYGQFLPTAITLDDGTLLCASVNYFSGSVFQYETRRRDADTGTWAAAVTVRDLQGIPADTEGITLLQLPSGRVHCYYLRTLDEGGTGYTVLSFSYSDDRGGTWTPGGDRLEGLREVSASFIAYKMRSAYHNGYITLTITAGDGVNINTHHLVSADIGSSFTEVETFIGGYSELVVDSVGKVILIYVTDGLDTLYSRKATPFSRFQDDPTHGTVLGTMAVDVSLGNCLAAAIGDSGDVWVYQRSATVGSHTKGMIFAFRYRLSDMSEVSDRWNADPGTNYHPIDTGDATLYPNDFTAVAQAGAMFLLTNWKVPGIALTGNTLSAIKLGGWTPVDWAAQTFGYNSSLGPGAGRSGRVYFPADVASAVAGITTTTGGTASDVVVTDGLQVTTTVGNKKYQWVGAAAGNPCLTSFSVKMITAGATASAKVGVRGTWGTGSQSTRFEMRISSTGIQVYDVRGAAIFQDVDAANVHAIDLTVQTEFLIYHFQRKVRIFYRALGATAWNTSHNSSIALAYAANADPCSLIWGHINANSTETSRWRWVAVAMDNCYIDPDLQAFINPSSLQGRECSLFPQWIDQGYRVRFTGSAGVLGDTFTAGTKYAGAVENLDPSTVPDGRSAWMSTNITQQVIAWEPEAGIDTRVMSPTVGVYIDGNFQTATFEGYNGTAWTVLATFDGSTQIMPSTAGPHPYTLTGNVLTAAGGSDQGGQFVGLDEPLTVVLTDTVAVSAAFKVKQNTAGVWGPDKPAARFLLDDNAAGDILAGTLGVPSGAVVYADRTLTLIHNVTAEYEAFRIVIPTQKTPEGYFMIRRLVVGPYLPFGMNWSWGKQHRKTANRSTYGTASGARRHRQDGPNRSSVQVSWPDGWDMSQIQGSDPVPDYMSPHSASAEAWGATQDATLPEQILDRTQGGVLPVVWCGRSSPSSVSTVEAETISNPSLILFGSVSDSVSRQVLVGDENDTELVGVSTMTITEEV